MCALLSPFNKNTLRAAKRPLGRVRRLGALLHWGCSCGALGLELLTTALVVGCLGGGDLGLVRAHVCDKSGAHRVDVGLEAFIGVVREEVPVATGVDAHHQPIGHAKLELELYAHELETAIFRVPLPLKLFPRNFTIISATVCPF